MKKFTAILLSMVLILSVGTTTALAEPGLDVLSALEGETLSSELETEENAQDLAEEEPSEELTTEDEAGLESDVAAEAEDTEEDEDSEAPDSLLEEEEEIELEEEEEPESDEEDEIETEELSIVAFNAEDYVEYEDLGSLSLSYDDRKDLSEIGLPAGENYVIYKRESEADEKIESHQVANGQMQDVLDEALLTLKDDSTTAIASGVGSGTVFLVLEDQVDDLNKILELDEESKVDGLEYTVLTDENSDDDVSENGGEETEDSENEDLDIEEEADDENLDSISIVEYDGTEDLDQVTVYQIEVTVVPATLTLMLLTGQSNMEGLCSGGYELSASVACEEGKVYSTYAPSASGNNTDDIAGISFSSYCTKDNASDFVAGALQGDTSVSGNTLEYPLDSLTTAGGGKAGPDSGLAYEWNKLTEDKVWVINTAWGGANIANWIPGSTYYVRTEAVWENVMRTYNAEVSAGHYTEGKKLIFWQQGEMGDANLTETNYEEQFDKMYPAMCEALGESSVPFGIIMVRAGYGAESGNDLKMTGPRIAQYWLGSSSSEYSNIFVVSNVNEQWVSDDGVTTYFQNKYSGGFSYPMNGGSKSLPTSVEEVHSDLHYSQIGHNENGITAAYGMYSALYGGASPSGASWRDEDGQEISSVSFELGGETTTMVETVDPSYAAKNVFYDYGSCASYDGATATLTGIETGTVTASYNGSTLSELTVNVTQSSDLTNVVGKNYTGFYEFNGVTWYLIDSYIQIDYEGVEQDTKKVIDSSAGWWYVKDGRLDTSYTGFAQNSNGWWYIEDGKVTFNKNSVIQDTNKKINGKSDWWYVVGSKVQEGFTGLADYSNSSGWWYIENGTVSFTYSGVEQNTNGWFYIQGSKVDFSYNGFAHNSNGWWYIEDGKVTFKKNSVILDSDKKVDGTSSWWYVVESKVQTTFTGLADYSNSNGWWYIENGKVSFTKDTIAQNKNGWYYVKDSKVDFNFTGLADFPNSNGWWYCENGKVTFKKDTIAKNKNGWWYIKDSKVDFSFTGLADFPNENGWWYCQDGKVNFNFNGIARNKNGWYYIVNSKVDFSFTGTVTAGGRRYSVTNGKVNR